MWGSLCRSEAPASYPPGRALFQALALAAVATRATHLEGRISQTVKVVQIAWLACRPDWRRTPKAVKTSVSVEELQHTIMSHFPKNATDDVRRKVLAAWPASLPGAPWPVGPRNDYGRARPLLRLRGLRDRRSWVKHNRRPYPPGTS